MTEQIVDDDLGEEVVPVNPTKRYVLQDLSTLSKVFDIITTNYAYYGTRTCGYDSVSGAKTHFALFNNYEGFPILTAQIGDTIIVNDASITKEISNAVEE